MRILTDERSRDWWKSAVFYQIYPRSFQDTTGSGVGDLRGVIRRLDYLAELGVNGIWLSPVCRSPQVDNGYDISDYRDIDPLFGTMADMEELIDRAGRQGIRIILDLVLNHCSDRHRWFLSARRSREDPYHDYFVWRDEPNEMCSVFGGSAWTWVPEVGQYYFHQFAEAQPDLNWENPAVRRELYDMIRFWVGKGVGGFRLDVIDQIAKDPDLRVTGNGPRLHEFLRELSAEAFSAPGLVTVGEAWGADVDRARLYSAPDGSELSMVFQFEHMCLDQRPGGEKWDPIPLPLPALKRCFARWQQGLHGRGWNSLFLNNHDLPRIVSRWGDDGEGRVLSAKMLGMMLHGMEGTPFIYQGEELGMTNIRLRPEQYVDIEIRNLIRDRTAAGYAPEAVMASVYARGRDNARTPMQWDDSPNAGFTTGTPWLPVNPNYRTVNAAAELADPDSVFRFYQALIRLRRELPVIREGSFELPDPDDPCTFAYIRRLGGTSLLVVCNFTAEERPLPVPPEYSSARLLLSNYPDRADTLRPWEALMLLAGE